MLCLFDDYLKRWVCKGGKTFVKIYIYIYLELICHIIVCISRIKEIQELPNHGYSL